MAFNFGTTPAPAFGAPAPSIFTGLSSQSAPAAAPVGGGFSFGNTSTTVPTTAAPITDASATLGFSGAPGAIATTSTADITTADIPEFGSCFPFLKVKSVISEILPCISSNSNDGRLKGEELVYRLQCIPQDGVYGTLLANPKPLKFTPEDPSLRQKLQQNPQIKLHGKTAILTPSMMEEIAELCSHLRISELEAIALYAEASNPATRQVLEVSLETGFVENVLSDQRKISPLVIGGNVVKAAKELYFWERSALMKTLLLLIQSRLEATHTSAILLATDPLLNNNLITNLITLIRDATKMIVDLREELSTHKPASSFPISPSANKKPPFANVLMEFIVEERHRAAECLFYLAYHTQCTPIEVASLIDVVKDLTNGVSANDNGLPILDPTKDVPDAYLNQDIPQQFYGQVFTSALPPLKQKDHVEWKKELIEKTWKSGKPQLQQCVSILISTVLCALDGRSKLWDRDSHCPNEAGNDLYRQQAISSPSDTDNITLIHERLDARNEASNDWKRKDIWGLLSGAYGVLLLPLHMVLASPRALGRRSLSGEPSPRSFDVRRTGKACLMAACEKKSCTFARLTLIPSFQRHRDGIDAKCDLYEFLMSTTSDFVSHYVDVLSASAEMPSSRMMWEENENENLKVQKDQQEQQRQFYVQYGATYDPPEPIPSHVNVLQCPDCIDDIVALACSICSAGPHFARRFWSTDNGQLVPSRLLSKLESMKNGEGTLIPAYVSFLAALTAADATNSTSDGATVVYQILSEQPASDAKFPVNWMSILRNIRWYARQLDPSYQVATSTPVSSLSGTGGRSRGASTAYYYGADNGGPSENIGYSGSLMTASAVTAADTKPVELGDANTAILLSHLAVISHVAAANPSARATLLSMTLSMDDADIASIDEDTTLLILFSLAMVGLTPHVRGAVFATIASLLNIDGASVDESRIIKDMANKAWDLLELSNIVPIRLLAQYQAAGFTAFQGMTFPRSSLSLAAIASDRKSNLPQDTSFGILYEMEHVESRMGIYPSTEGFLQLITSLISSAGCPQDLGKSVQGVTSGRAQQGCSPYVEYVIHFVLPRAVGSDTTAGILPFITCGDQNRLVAMALDVVERIITHYSIPFLRPGSGIPQLADDIQSQIDTISAALKQFQLPSLAKSLVIQADEYDMQGYRLDFIQNVTRRNAPEEESIFPRAKSPGYMIMLEILSIYGGELFNALIFVITNCGVDVGIQSVCALEAYKSASAQGLFLDFQPSLVSAKVNVLESASVSRATFLQPLFTNHNVKSNTAMLMNDFVLWQELSLMRSLLILCAATVREDAFISATSGCATCIPVLQFKASISSISTISAPLSKLKNIFVGSQVCGSHKFLQILCRLIGYSCRSPMQEACTASAALALAIYSCNDMPLKESMSALGGEKNFVSSVSYRLRASLSLHTESTVHVDIVKRILSLLDQQGISDVLLGFSNSQKAQVSLLPSLKSNDCFDAILSLLQDESFVTDPATSSFAVKCYEIVYRQISRDDTVSTLVQNKLKDATFWKANMWRFLACREAVQKSLLSEVSEKSGNILHSTAWFLKALSHYISSDHEFELLELISSPHYFLLEAFDTIPLEGLWGATDTSQLIPISHLVDAAMTPINGPEDITGRFKVISKAKLEGELMRNNPGITERDLKNILSSADDWNGTVEWACATSHISHACTVLLESCLACIYNHSPDILERTAEGQIQLLDLLLQRIASVLHDDVVLESSYRHICTSVLFLVERLVSGNDSTLTGKLGFFINSMLNAALRAVSEDVMSLESAALLVSSLVILLSVDSQFEISEEQNTDISKIICSFASLHSESVNGGELVGPQNAFSIVSSTFLSSLLTHHSRQANQDALRSLLGKGVLEPLIRAMSILDDDAPILLAQVATTEEGARNLIKFGTMHAIEAAFQFYQKKEALLLQELSIGAIVHSDTLGVPNFLGSHLDFMSTILGSTAFKGVQQYELASLTLSVLCSYNELLERVRRAFPQYGDVWTAFVKCVFHCNTIFNKQGAGIVRNWDTKVPHEQLGKLKLFIAPIAIDILQNPLPQRFLVPLPLNLQSDTTKQQNRHDVVEWKKQRSWWKGIEESLLNTSSGTIILPPPLTTFIVDGIERGQPWSNYKYNVCLDGMRLLDISLSIFAGKHEAALFRFEYACLARGLCCLADSFKAIGGRLKSFSGFNGSSRLSQISDGMDVDYDQDRQALMKMEKDYLSHLLPLFERCIEKLLLVIHCQFQAGQGSMSSDEWKGFGKMITLALEHFDFENLEIGKGDFVSKLCQNLRVFANKASAKI